MAKVELSKAAKAAIVDRIQRYFAEELDQEIGTLPAEFLLEFFSEAIGPHHYNAGLRDAHAAFLGKMDDMAEVIYLLEKPVETRR